MRVPGRRVGAGSVFKALTVLSVVGLVAATQGWIGSGQGGGRFPSMPAELASKLAKKTARQKAAEMRPFTAAGEAQEFYALKRAPVGETAIPVERYAAALQHMDRMPQFASADGRELPPREVVRDSVSADAFASPWTELGPGNIGGRTRSILIHPTTPDTMYIAGVAGGVWKTTNGGTTWAPLDDLMANLAVGSMAMDPANPNVIYAGTGEGVFNGDAVRGAGIFKTTNGGASWSQLASTNNSNFHYVNDVIVSDNNSNRLYAATRTGVYRSLDGGVSWALVLNGAAVNGCMDLAARTDTATDYVFASCGTFTQATIYRNTDAGGAGAWSSVYTEAGMGRTIMAIAPSNQTVIYALSAHQSTHALHAVFRSTSSGDVGSWTARVRSTSPVKLNTVLLTNTVYAFLSECGFGASQNFNQGWYDISLAVDPLNSDRVWAGGIDLFRSTDGAANWAVASRWWGGSTGFNHADQHTIAFHPGYNGTSNQRMFTGNDGGIYRTDNAVSGTTSTATTPGSFLCGGAPPAGFIVWQELNNNYGATQFYHGLPYPDGDEYFGGTQDNGTVRGTDAGGSDNWAMIQGGDGGYVAVDPTNPNVIYAEFTGISIQKSTNGGASFTQVTSGIFDSGLFINPFAMDPNDPDTLWTGGQFPWRTTNAAANWQQAGASFGSNVSSIAIATGNSNRVLMGTTSGAIRLTTTGTTSGGGTAWGSTTPRSGFVSSVAFDPTNEMVAYATYSNFGGSHVFKSTNGGATFSPIDGAGATAIPDIPAHSIVVDPSNTSRLYVGTDLGVFVSRDGGATWAVENNGFANTVTETLAMGSVSGVPNLFAFTHGRGAFRVAPVDGGTLPTVTITATDGTATEAGPTTGTMTVSRTGSTASPLTVNYTVGGTATSGSDYTALSGSVTIPGGSASAPVVVTPIDDAAVEVNETVVATLAANAAYTVGSPSNATVTIVSDDVATTPPDLVVTKLTTNPKIGGAGLPLTIKDTTTNSGAGPAPATTTTLFLSTDANLDGGDTVLGSRAVPALAAGTSSAGSTNVTLPAGVVGKRWIIARADNANAAAESNEGNNIRTKVIYIGPDLIVKTLTGPGSASRGATVSVTVRTDNIGGAATTAASSTRIYLSTNKKVDASDDLLGSVAIPNGFPVGASSTVAVSVTIPAGTATGPRFFLAVADGGGTVPEAKENNNNKTQAVTINP
jgi:hypothetical protein